LISDVVKDDSKSLCLPRYYDSELMLEQSEYFLSSKFFTLSPASFRFKHFYDYVDPLFDPPYLLYYFKVFKNFLLSPLNYF